MINSGMEKTNMKKVSLPAWGYRNLHTYESPKQNCGFTQVLDRVESVRASLQRIWWSYHTPTLMKLWYSSLKRKIVINWKMKFVVGPTRPNGFYGCFPQSIMGDPYRGFYLLYVVFFLWTVDRKSVTQRKYRVNCVIS